MELLEKIGQGLLLIAIITALLYCAIAIAIAIALDIFYQRCDPGGIEESERRTRQGETGQSAIAPLGESIPAGAPREDEDDE